MLGITLALLASVACGHFSTLETESHDSVELVQRIATVAEPSSPSQPMEGGDWEHRKPKKILIFVPVGSKFKGLVHVQIENMRVVRKFEKASHKKVKFDFFFVHYDLNQQKWREQVGEDWYDKNIRYSAELQGVKFWMGSELLRGASTSGAERPNMNDYDWIWFLDEDGDFSRMDLGRMLAGAEDSGSLIVAPSILFMDDLRLAEVEEGCQHGRVECNFQAPHKSCSRRYVSFIELSFPMLKPAAFEALAASDGAVNKDSAWGLDKIWCGLTAKKVRDGSLKTACTILDSSPIVHRNFKTLFKYGNRTANILNGKTDGMVRNKYPKEYNSGMKTYECVS